MPLPIKIPKFDTLKRQIIALDIESEGASDNNLYRIYSIGIKTHDKYYINTNENEKELLLWFITLMNDLIDNNNITYICGHNIMMYDMSHIYYRILKHKIHNKIITKSTYQRKHRRYGLYHEYFIKGCEIIDTMFMAQDYDAVYSIFSDMTLKTVAIELGCRTERRLELDLKEIRSEFKSKNYSKLEEYLKYDLDDTLDVGLKLMPSYYYQQMIVPRNTQTIIHSTTARRVDYIMDSYYKKKLTESDPKYKYQGGYNEAYPGLYTNVIKLDIASLYPSIMLIYKLGPTPQKDPNGYFLSVLRYLTQERLKFKKLGKTEPYYKMISDAYKILINSFYGYLGADNHPYNNMEAAEKVSAYGRKIIKYMISILKELKCNIVEVDTDGIILSCPNNEHKQIVEHLQSKLPKGINVDLEFVADWCYVNASKNYIVHNENGTGKTTYKGIYKKRNMMKLLKEFTFAYCTTYIINPEEAENYYNILQELISEGTIPRHLVCITRKIAVSEKRLLQLGDAGEKITYIESYNVAGESVPSTNLTDPINTKHYKNYLTDIYKTMRQNITGELLVDPDKLAYENIFEYFEQQKEQSTNILEELES